MVTPVKISFDVTNDPMTAPSSVLSGLNMIVPQVPLVSKRLVEVIFWTVLNQNVNAETVLVELCPIAVFPYAL